MADSTTQSSGFVTYHFLDPATDKDITQARGRVTLPAPSTKDANILLSKDDARFLRKQLGARADFRERQTPDRYNTGTWHLQKKLSALIAAHLDTLSVANTSATTSQDAAAGEALSTDRAADATDEQENSERVGGQTDNASRRPGWPTPLEQLRQQFSVE